MREVLVAQPFRSVNLQLFKMCFFGGNEFWVEKSYLVSTCWCCLITSSLRWSPSATVPPAVEAEVAEEELLLEEDPAGATEEPGAPFSERR